MASLNDMVLQLSSTNDTKKKLTIGQDIIDHLGQPENSVECDDLGGFIDTLVPFMQSSNFKVFMFIIKFVFFSKTRQILLFFYRSSSLFKCISMKICRNFTKLQYNIASFI